MCEGGNGCEYLISLRATFFCVALAEPYSTVGTPVAGSTIGGRWRSTLFARVADLLLRTHGTATGDVVCCSSQLCSFFYMCSVSPATRRMSLPAVDGASLLLSILALIPAHTAHVSVQNHTATDCSKL